MMALRLREMKTKTRNGMNLCAPYKYFLVYKFRIVNEFLNYFAIHIDVNVLTTVVWWRRLEVARFALSWKSRENRHYYKMMAFHISDNVLRKSVLLFRVEIVIIMMIIVIIIIIVVILSVVVVCFLFIFHAITEYCEEYFHETWVLYSNRNEMTSTKITLILSHWQNEWNATEKSHEN